MKPPFADRFRSELQNLESQLVGSLRAARERYDHKGIRGSNAEHAFREFLREYLPRRLAVGHGEVIDTHGERSRQTDCVIATEDHPFTFSETQAGLFFVEGVAAVAEIKSVLTSDELDRTIDASRQFKKLRIEPGHGTTILTQPADRDRYYVCPPYFLFAFESNLTVATICERLSLESESPGGVRTDLLDAVFVLNRGHAINLGKGGGSFAVYSAEGKERSGWFLDESPEHILFELISWLSVVMPRFVRYDPILPAYLLQSRRSAP